MSTDKAPATVDEMTANVPDFGPSLRAAPVKITTITIKTRCPACGGPRGVPYKTLIDADGLTHECDTWNNPCGHVDLNADMLIEAGVYPPYEERT